MCVCILLWGAVFHASTYRLFHRYFDIWFDTNTINLQVIFCIFHPMEHCPQKGYEKQTGKRMWHPKQKVQNRKNSAIDRRA
jgi:hypothetical protein